MSQQSRPTISMVPTLILVPKYQTIIKWSQNNFSRNNDFLPFPRTSAFFDVQTTIHFLPTAVLLILKMGNRETLLSIKQELNDSTFPEKAEVRRSKHPEKRG